MANKRRRRNNKVAQGETLGTEYTKKASHLAAAGFAWRLPFPLWCLPELTANGQEPLFFPISLAEPVWAVTECAKNYGYASTIWIL